MPTLAKAIFIFLCIAATTNSQAKSQALLIGIGQYPERQALEGPVNDVTLIRELLLQSKRFHRNNIKVLLDKDATRDNILYALDEILKSTVRGDKIILYFSGHGTSALNDQIDVDLPSNSGALVPYDIKNVSDKNELHQRLLIGRRDLRPVLSQLDATGAEVLVLVDACFSGNVVRGEDTRSLPVRFLDFSEILPFWKNQETNEPSQLVKGIPYPYQNVYLIAAAQEDQTALDIPEDRASQFKTIDLQSHGAFTDSLVQSLLGLYKSADETGATLTLKDLHVATRRLMKKKGFLSIPTLLPDDPAHADTPTLISFFGESVTISNPVEN